MATWGMLIAMQPVTQGNKIAHVAAIIAGTMETKWLQTFDPDGANGRGLITTTTDKTQAMRFDSEMDALNCWKTSSTTHPSRDDGLPNRPLTAYSIQVLRLP